MEANVVRAIDPIALIRSSLRIALRTPALWMLTLLLYCALLPAFLLAGGFGAATAYFIAPSQAFGAANVNSPLLRLPIGGWIAYILVTLLVLTTTTLFSWAIQAALIRGSDAAAAGQAVSIRASLQLGKQRWQSLTKLALTFGVIIQALGILPLVLVIAFSGGDAGRAGMLSLAQTVLLPVDTVLGILLFLLTMSIALEDVRPRAAMQRVWKLMRGSWWGFLLAYLLQILLAMAFIIPFAFLLTIAIFLALSGLFLQSSLEYILAGAICVFSSPVALAFLTFIMVFSTVFFTQIYRAAAKLE
jgi:hypothetical protein